MFQRGNIFCKKSFVGKICFKVICNHKTKVKNPLPKNFIANLRILTNFLEKKRNVISKKGRGGGQGRLEIFKKTSIFGETVTPYISMNVSKGEYISAIVTYPPSVPVILLLKNCSSTLSDFEIFF